MTVFPIYSNKVLLAKFRAEIRESVLCLDQCIYSDWREREITNGHLLNFPRDIKQN